MPFDMFLKRKKDILSKGDKSFIGEVDKKIRKLCGKINALQDYYTTSSCSGRVVLIIDKEKKQKGLMLKLYHDNFSFEELKKDIGEIMKNRKNKDVKFKMEPCALHVSCRSFEDAERINGQARLAGWKKSGIISSERRFIVEMNSTDRLEFPFIRKGKMLVDDNFLKIVVLEANKKLKRCWERIAEMEKRAEKLV
jgi:tRNA wybutosine-synthesizing protein 3